MTPIQRGNVLLAMSLAMIAGNLVYGQIEPRFDHCRRPVVLGSAIVVTLPAALAVRPVASPVAVTLLLAALGGAGNLGLALIA